MELKNVYGPMIPVVTELTETYGYFKKFSNRDWTEITGAYLKLTSATHSIADLMAFTFIFADHATEVKFLALLVEEYARPNFTADELLTLCELKIDTLVDAASARKHHIPVNLVKPKSEFFNKLFNQF